MIKYLINAVNTVRVHTVEEAEAYHEELKRNTEFDLVSFAYTVKDIKVKREVIDQYVVIKYKVVFNDEKDPQRELEVEYNEV